jgi:hypothetical protein
MNRASDIVVVSLVLASALGWVLNVITLLSQMDTLATGEIVLRCFGIPIALLGAVLGYL